jgi:hypothetical protein
MKNNRRKRGAAIELAILALAIAAIFGTLAVSVTLSEARLIKVDKAELTEVYKRIECERTAKDSIKRILKKDGEPTSSSINTGGMATAVPKISEDGNSCKIISWEWIYDEKQD